MTLIHKMKKDIFGAAVGSFSCAVKKIYPISHHEREAKIFYGGAYGGNKGGPQVKVTLLQKSFPENIKNFNLLYLLSGALYMPPWAIKKIKDQGVSVVLNQNGVFYPAWFPDTWREENDRMARVMALSDYVFYQSNFCKKSADKFLGVSAKKYEILYNGVDTDLFKPMTLHERRKTSRFLITGHIVSSTYYRLSTALNSLVKARKQGLDIEIIFSGMMSPDLQMRIKSEIHEKNMHNFFHLRPPYSRKDAPRIFSHTDAYLMTKHNDPCPNVVLEAMACGLPVLHVSSGGVPELVGSHAGICLNVPETYTENPQPDTDSIIEAMSKIIENREGMAQAARNRAVQMFDLKIWINRHRQIFENILDERNGK